MAHVGKFWPVLFRRDFNLNLQNNALGWARRYLAFFTFNCLGTGQNLSGAGFDCGPDEYPDPLSMLWRSGFIRVGAELYELSLRATVVNGRKFKRTATYDNALAGKVLELQWFDPPEGDHPNFPVGPEVKVVFWNLAFFDFEPQFPQAFVFEKRWKDGPPH